MLRKLRLFRSLLLALLTVAILFQASCGRVRARTSIYSTTILQAVRSYRGGHEGASPLRAEPVGNPSPDTLETGNDYALRIAALLEQGKFEELDKEAQHARVTKARVLGGVWKIYDFYGDLIPSGNSEADYNWAIGRIKAWIAARPQSATARIALANAYEGFAWLARGNGYADTITDDAWQLFHERVELAKAPLLEAAHMDERCPYWYSAVMQLALDEGWDKSEAREIVDQANLFEPTYYHIYRQYANYVLPKWYGKPGETQAFAEEISNRLGESQGSFVYYELATLVACQCDQARDSLHNMSWPRIKNGFHEMRRLYGVSNLKWNRYGYMAYLSGDKEAAQEAFAQIGSDWQREIWYSAGTFEYAKNWASTP